MYSKSDHRISVSVKSDSDSDVKFTEPKCSLLLEESMPIVRQSQCGELWALREVTLRAKRQVGTRGAHGRYRSRAPSR